MARSSQLSRVSLKRFFARLPDPRRRRGRVRHPLINIVVLALCGVIAGADTPEEIARFAQARRDWFGRLLDLRAGIPSHDTIGRVLAALDPQAFQEPVSKVILTKVSISAELGCGQGGSSCRVLHGRSC
jgi:hypothetical protein